jgi:hypothetical protein
MKRVIEAIANFFRRLFAPGWAERFVAGVDAAAPYLRTAYELAAIAAAMTPTRADDELLALAQKLRVPDLWRSEISKGEAIARIVYLALRERYPDATERSLKRAIEIAYGAIRP